MESSDSTMKQGSVMNHTSATRSPPPSTRSPESTTAAAAGEWLHSSGCRGVERFCGCIVGLGGDGEEGVDSEISLLFGSQ